MKFVKYIKYSLTIIILSSLQVSLCRYISVFGVEPNIVLAFVVSVSVINGPVTGAVIGLICGIFMDSLSTGTHILYSLTYMYIAIMTGILTINFLRKNIGAAMFFSFIGSVINEEFVHFLHYTIWGSSKIFSGLVYPIMPIAIYTTLITIPIYLITKKLFTNDSRRDYIY